MNNRRWQRIDRVFGAALEQPPLLRAGWLDAASQGDESLKHEVISLLAAHEASGPFLERPAVASSASAAGGIEFQIGQQVGHYEILERLGAGGMGAVYRATDRRLGREVAVKCLPAAWVHDTEWLRRFHEEARAAGALNHPNVVTVHDIGDGVGGPYIVSELLQGETLRSRMERGPIGIRRAVEIAVAIARGLAAAHGRQIVHRDLKPENVFLTENGQVKIIDFGIAQRIAGLTADESGDSAPVAAPMVIGTAAYLSPEQVAGQSSDPRSDLFALGIVLYEMLCGSRPFHGATPDETMRAILIAEPARLNPARRVPIGLERVLWACLAKEPAQRFQSASDVALTLESFGGEPLSTVPGEVAATPERRLRRRLAWSGIAALVAALSVPPVVWFLSRPRETAVPITFELLPPAGSTFVSGPVVSPDGVSIVFVDDGPDGRFLWVRNVSSGAWHRIAGSNHATQPFWSPDATSLGFFADGKLKRVAVSDGPAVILADALTPRGGTWTTSGTIVYAPTLAAGLMAVPQGGGEPWTVTSVNLSRGENSHRWPSALPDGRHLLFFSRSSQADQAGVYVADAAPGAGGPVLLLHASSNAVLGTNALGANVLLFVRNGSLFERGFDPQTLRLLGDEHALAGDVGDVSPNSAAAFSASRTAVLAYSSWAGFNERLEYEDINGRPIHSLGDPGIYVHPRLSPDGHSVAVGRLDGKSGHVDIWIMNTSTSRASRLTTEGGFNSMPAWSPDGLRIAFTTVRTDPDRSDLYSRAADGTGPETCLLCAPGRRTGPEWTPDGRFVLYESIVATGVEIWAVRTAPGQEPSPVLTSGTTICPRVSPDGRWLAYVSEESGRREVYVRRFRSDGNTPVVGAAWTLSTTGGNEPRWRRDGRALYFVGPDRHLMMASFGTSRPLVSRAPIRLAASFDSELDGLKPPTLAHYDVATGTSGLIVATRVASAASAATVIVGWPKPVAIATPPPRE